MDFSGFLFQPGLVITTPGVLLEFSRTGEGFMDFLDRHLVGDWGEVTVEERFKNKLAISKGGSVMSGYRTGNGEPLCVVTDLMRRTTCFFLADEIQLVREKGEIHV